MIDTCFTDITEDEVKNHSGVRNEAEADIVVRYVQNLLNDGIKKEDIGIITPYNLQVILLREKLFNVCRTEIDVSTVDGFQGHEKEIIILSMVRSNSQGKVGFLNSARRNNVAVTRAKSHLVMVCNSITLSNDRHIRKFIEIIRSEGQVINYLK